MHQSCCCWWSATLFAGLLLGMLLPGCSPSSEPGDKEKSKQAKKAAEPQQPQPAATPEAKQPELKPEATAKPEATPEPPAKPEVKAEPPAKPESQPEAKAEPPAKAEAKPEAKPDAKTEAPAKPEAKTEGAAAGSEGMPAPPKVSSFAPADDLVYQMDKYIALMEKGTADEASYKEDLAEGVVSQTGSTMVLLAVALGLSDQDNKYKANAGAMAAACQKLAVAADYAATKQAVAGVVAAAKGEGKGTVELKWSRLADLPALMKQVPKINNNQLRPSLRKLDARAKDAGASSATLAVIAQGAMANVAETVKPKESQQWFAFCTEMREAAAAVNASARVKNAKAVSEAMDRLQESCDHCHAIFKEEKKK
jgi:hypothetical protein